MVAQFVSRVAAGTGVLASEWFGSPPVLALPVLAGGSSAFEKQQLFALAAES